MTSADLSQDRAKRVSGGVHPLWRVACLAMVALNVGAAVWWYAATSVQSKAVVREIASRCNMDAVFPSMIVPQDGDLIVFVDDDNSREDIEALAEIVGRLGRDSLIDRISIEVDGNDWNISDFASVMERCHRYSVFVDVYLARTGKRFTSVP